jgi:hypothetical protein
VPSNLEAFVKVTRTFRDGSSQDWWALEVVTGLDAPHKQERVVIATTDLVTLPSLSTFSPFHQSAGARIATGCRQRPGLSQSGGSGAALWTTDVGRTEPTSTSNTRLRWSQYQV